MGHRVTASRCPTCGAEHDAASDPNDDAAVPTPGSYTVCINCAALLRFGQGFELEPVSVSEELSLDRQTRGQIARVQTAIHLLRAERGE